MLVKGFVRSQFEPGTIFALILLVLIGMGGMLFLKFYWEGLQLHAITKLAKQISLSRCEFVIQGMMGNEYIRKGYEGDDEPWRYLSNRYEKIDEYSYEFNEKMDELKLISSEIGSKVGKEIIVDGFLAPRSEIAFLLEHIEEEGITDVCIWPVYGPWEGGSAYIVFSYESPS